MADQHEMRKLDGKIVAVYKDNDGDEYRYVDGKKVYLADEGSTFKIELTDGNAIKTVNDYIEAEEVVSEWYEFISDDERYEGIEMPSFNPDGKDICDCDDLNALISEWEEAIAEACGKVAFHGHGNYSVSAASEMGLHLHAKIVDGE